MPMGWITHCIKQTQVVTVFSQISAERYYFLVGLALAQPAFQRLEFP